MRKAVLIIALASIPAMAQADPVSDDRFQIEKSGDSYIRLDRQTGTISTCTMSGPDLDCRASADERAALQAVIDRLSGEVERLKTGTAETASGASISKDGKELTLKLPSESEIKQVVAFFQDMLQRAVDAVKDLVNKA